MVSASRKIVWVGRVISGLVSDRGWIAEAMGVEPADVLARFQDAALNPLPWREVKKAPVQEIVLPRAGAYPSVENSLHLVEQALWN